MQNKKILLFTLIFLLGCFGILGVVEKGEAAGCTSIYCDPVISNCDEDNYTGNFLCGKIAKATMCPTFFYRCLKDSAERYKIECDLSCNCINPPTLINKCYDECCKAWKKSDDYECVGDSCQLAVVIPALPVEICNNGIDDDGDGNIDCDDSDCVGDPACAVVSANGGDETIALTTKPISEILKDLIKWLLQIVILLAILMLIVSGVMYMISSGDAEKANTAKRTFSYAILGLFVAGLAWAIVKTVVDLLS